jgi:hypothetical protein
MYFSIGKHTKDIKVERLLYDGHKINFALLSFKTIQNKKKISSDGKRSGSPVYFVCTLWKRPSKNVKINCFFYNILLIYHSNISEAKLYIYLL